MFVQVWDFQLQKSRDMTYDGAEEASLSVPKSMKHVLDMSSSTLGDYILSRNVSHSLYIVVFQSVPIQQHVEKIELLTFETEKQIGL